MPFEFQVALRRRLIEHFDKRLDTVFLRRAIGGWWWWLGAVAERVDVRQGEDVAIFGDGWTGARGRDVGPIGTERHGDRRCTRVE